MTTTATPAPPASAGTLTSALTDALTHERVLSSSYRDLLRQLCEAPTMAAGYELLADWCAACGHQQPAALSAPPVPNGWKLVPEVPTDEMCEAAWDAATDYVGEHRRIHSAHEAYTAMLSAAPAPGANGEG